MKLQGFKRLNKTDYEQEQQELIDKLSNIVNQMEGLYSSLDRKLTLKENALCDYKELSIQHTSDGAIRNANVLPVTFLKSNRVIGIQVLDARCTSNTSLYPVAGVFISYDVKENGILITNVAGLPDNSTFTLTFVIHGT